MVIEEQSPLKQDLIAKDKQNHNRKEHKFSPNKLKKWMVKEPRVKRKL